MKTIDFKVMFLIVLFLVCGLSLVYAEVMDTAALELSAYEAYQQDKFQDAVNEYKKIIEADPGNYKAYYNLGLAYAKLEDYTAAVESFKKALESDVDKLSKDALYNLSVIYGKYLNDAVNAEVYYQQFKKIQE